MSSAIPGVMLPGLAQPGQPADPGAGVSAIFTGTETLTYLQYLDTATMRTLVARPGGGTYGISVASGYVNVGTLPDDGRWIRTS